MDSALPYLIGLIAVALPSRFIFYRTSQRWLGKFEQRAKWNFCLTAAMVAADQERR
jgi:hypothetical protein